MKKQYAQKVVMVMVAVILSLPLCATKASAAEQGSFLEPRREKVFDELTRDLGLSPAQEKDLKNLRETFAAKRKEVKQKITLNTAKLRDELEKPVTDNTSVEKLIAELKDLYGEQLHNRVENIQAVKRILTPEQFAKFQEELKAKRQQFREKQGFRLNNR